MSSPETFTPEAPKSDIEVAQFDHDAILDLVPETKATDISEEQAAKDKEILQQWTDENRENFIKANQEVSSITERPREQVTDATVGEASKRAEEIMRNLGNVGDHWMAPRE